MRQNKAGMTAPPLRSKTLVLQQVAALAVAAAIITGFVLLPEPNLLAGYIAVVLAASLPLFQWLRQGATSLPIMAFVAAVYIPAFGLAGVVDNPTAYRTVDIRDAQFTVAAFLIVASVAAQTFGLVAAGRLHFTKGDAMMSRATTSISIGALLVGATFHIAAMLGSLDRLGTLLGPVRTIAENVIAVGCYFLGYSIATRSLSNVEKVLSFGLVSLIALMEMRTLYIYSALTDFIVLAAGYVITARRIPWMSLAIGLLIASVLNASKTEMRERYWVQGTGIVEGVSLSQVPELVFTWFSAGVDNLTSGNQTEGQGLFQRASQLYLVMLVEDQTPRNIGFLYGETYANFPRMLVPRFLDPNKIISQENLSILSVHYGLQAAQDKLTTTISWSVIAEAYANFGYAGVICAALVFGALIGVLTSLTVGVPPISIGGLIGLVAMVTCIQSIGYDFSYMLLNLVQAIASALVFAILVPAISRRVRNLRRVSRVSVRG